MAYDHYYIIHKLTEDGLPRWIGIRADCSGTQGLFASHGDFYATTVVERLGLAREGLVRIGCACYTTEEEIERFLDAVCEIAQGEAR